MSTMIWACDARDAVLSALRGPLPGAGAHSRLNPRTAPEPKPAIWREAAVLILLYPNGSGGVSFPLLVRGYGSTYHKGQIGLPGGSREDGESLGETALRETEEEIGVSRTGIEILGALTPLRVFRSGFVISPFVGWIAERPEFSLQENEVASLFEAGLEALLDPLSVSEAVIEAEGLSLPAPCYALSGRVVWGATAMILAELAFILAGEATMPIRD